MEGTVPPWVLPPGQRDNAGEIREGEWSRGSSGWALLSGGVSSQCPPVTQLHLPSRPLWLLCVLLGKPRQENERLRTQALKKAKEEKVENSKKESELLGARRELESLRKQHQKLSKKLLKYSLFKRYLVEVVENSQVSLDVAQGGPHLGLNHRGWGKAREINT